MGKKSKKTRTSLDLKLDIKAINTQIASILRGIGLDDNQISVYLSGSKKLCTGLPFNVAEVTTIEKLGLVRHGDSEEYWQPEMEILRPSQEFKKFLEEAPHVWGLTNEAAKRVVINMFLHEVVTQLSTISEEGKRVYPVKLWCELWIQRDDVQGKIDYVGGEKANVPVVPYVIVVEAKMEWPANGYCQLLAEMYAVMMENGKNQTVFGALTNETLWQFYKLDTDMKWHQSDLYVRNQKTEEILGILAAMLQR